MTYDPIDTNENDNNADGSLTIDDLTATTVAGLDTSSGTVNAQIFTDGEGGLIAGGYSDIPVAFENLVAWYPFDSATYGGNNADDVTAREVYYGDSTAYDGTVNGATYQSSGGVTDINAGANSGAFDFAGDPDEIDVAVSPGDLDGFSEITAMAWTNVDDFQQGANGQNSILGKYFDDSDRSYFLRWEDDDLRALVATNSSNANNDATASNVGTENTWIHCAFTWSGSTNIITVYVNGQSQATGTSNGSTVRQNTQDFYIGDYGEGGSFDGTIDDVRIYDTALSQAQINQIYLNTEP
jgi:hypothetical protein